jgi:hypothetical protein
MACTSGTRGKHPRRMLKMAALFVREVSFGLSSEEKSIWRMAYGR